MSNVSDSSHGVSRVVHHKDYYLRGGDMTVLVENHLYRIHSYFFHRESLFFRQKFGNVDNSEERGSTDKNAYTLEDVKSEDFARFLWVFYNPRYSIFEAPLETWLSVIRLANRWSFDSVKELAVRELEKITIEPVEKIRIYHEENISRLYLIPSYVDVCKRDKPMSFSEGMKLGMETVLRIAEARERMRLLASESGIRSPTFEDFEDEEVEVLIREIFQLGPRPTSPTTAPASNGINGNAPNVCKLGPAPAGHPQKANGAHAPRANGGSATDVKRPSDSMPSIASVTQTQESAVKPNMEAPPTGTQPMATQKQQVVSTPQATPPPPPPPSDKPDNKGAESPRPRSATQPPKSAGGLGEPLFSVDSSTPSNSHLSNNPVVQSSERSNDLTAKSNDVVDGKRDELAKDIDTASVASDTEGGKGGKSTGKNKNRGGRGGTQGGRGGKQQ